MGKSILITGAGTGIGKDAAFELVKRGHFVMATTETKEQANALRLEAERLNARLEIFKLDITKAADRELVKSREIDVLICNAGIGESGSIAEIDIDKIRYNFEVNVFSNFELSQPVLKNMFAKNSGTVIFISSLAGRIAMPFLGPYCMTKFALSSGAETMRTEIHRVRKNVHISLVEPGGYHTGFNQRNMAKKYEWMDESSLFYPIMDQIKKEEARSFKVTESKSNKSIMSKIVKASEAKKPRLRYSAPAWQAFGVWFLRVLGK